jgi:hypothetical protein
MTQKFRTSLMQCSVSVCYFLYQKTKMKKMPGFEHAQTGKGITAPALPLIPNLEKTDTSFYWNIFLTTYKILEYPFTIVPCASSNSFKP